MKATLNGRGARNWIAEEIVRYSGPEEALRTTTGPMRKAVEEVIRQMKDEEANTESI